MKMYIIKLSKNLNINEIQGDNLMKDISYIDKIVKQHRTNLHKIAELSHVEFKTPKYIRD